MLQIAMARKEQWVKEVNLINELFSLPLKLPQQKVPKQRKPAPVYQFAFHAHCARISGIVSGDNPALFCFTNNPLTVNIFDCLIPRDESISIIHSYHLISFPFCSRFAQMLGAALLYSNSDEALFFQNHVRKLIQLQLIIKAEKCVLILTTYDCITNTPWVGAALK